MKTETKKKLKKIRAGAAVMSDAEVKWKAIAWAIVRIGWFVSFTTLIITHHPWGAAATILGMGYWSENNDKAKPQGE